MNTIQANGDHMKVNTISMLLDNEHCVTLANGEQYFNLANGDPSIAYSELCTMVHTGQPINVARVT